MQEEGIMKGFVKLTLISSMLFAAILFGREKAELQAEKDAGIMYDGKEYVITEPGTQENSNESREEIILWEEDFENNAEGWATGSGWQLTTDEYNSETHSMNSPNDASTLNGTYNLLSPTLSMAELGDGETMNFGEFMLWVSLLYSSVVNCHPEPVAHPSALFSKSSSQRIISSRLSFEFSWVPGSVITYSFPSYIIPASFSACNSAFSRPKSMAANSILLIRVSLTNPFIIPSSCIYVNCFILPSNQSKFFFFILRYKLHSQRHYFS
jgi:hypothetical protein